MKLIKPYYKILTPINGEEILFRIEKAARTCYKSEKKFEAEISNGMDVIDTTDIDFEINKPGWKIFSAKSARILISTKLMKFNHEAMLEFGGMITVRFVCDRGVSHELVRHRISSFAQESTRYCNYGKDDHVTFIIPNWLDYNEGRYPIVWDELIGTCTRDYESKIDGGYNWFWNMAIAERDYNHLIRIHNWSPQQARSVLPNSLKTEINVSANIREWRHIFRLRTASGAHPQMIELMKPLLEDFKKQIPILFDDI